MYANSIAAFFIIAQNWKESTCPAIIECLSERVLCVQSKSEFSKLAFLFSVAIFML